jgi:hypothetical protein
LSADDGAGVNVEGLTSNRCMRVTLAGERCRLKFLVVLYRLFPDQLKGISLLK